MGLLDILFGSDNNSSPNSNQQSSTSSKPAEKRILYQCRYCSYKSVRKASQGAPLPGVNNCPYHPRGAHKGPHSWMRTYL